VAGLATDFSAGVDGDGCACSGSDAYVIEDACRGIDTQGSLAAAWKKEWRRPASRSAFISGDGDGGRGVGVIPEDA
jgi:hypothetical protein